MTPTDAIPILIGEHWITPEIEAHTPVFRPATGEVIGRTPQCDRVEVDLAVEAASRAFASWSAKPAPERARVLFRYRELLEEQFEHLAEILCGENGKTREEARGDVRRGIEVVELACGIGQMAKGEVLPELAAGIDGAATREPVGICAGITPFNFPAMVPMWMYPLAIACGNCFVLKPSEKVPFTANHLAELFLEAGLPPGVLNVVHGGRDVVEALCRHPGIAAISFVGSSPVARRVYELTGQTGKRCQAAGGAKNVLLVMPDAVESGLFGEAAAADPTLNAVMHSAFGCAGQRCMAGSLLMGIGDASDGLRDQLASAMDTMTVGDTLRDDVDMGPVIDGAAQQRLGGRIADAASADLAVVRDGREGVPDTGFYVGPTLLDGVTPGHGLFAEELSRMQFTVSMLASFRVSRPSFAFRRSYSISLSFNLTTMCSTRTAERFRPRATFTTTPTISDSVSLSYQFGYPVVKLPLASRPELCTFTLQPVSHTVADFIKAIKAEDGGIDRVALIDKDGSKIAQTTPIGLALWDDFSIAINDKKYDIQVPDDRKGAKTATAFLETYGDVKTMIHKLHVALNVEEHQRKKEEEIRLELERLEHELAPLEELHTEMAKKSQFRTSIAVWGGLGYMALQFGILARLTWWEYSWDIMEPVTYFIGYGTAMACYAYFVLTRQDYTFPDVRNRQYMLFLYRFFGKKRFDVNHYNELKNAVAAKKDQLRCLHDALQLNLTAPRKLDSQQ